jgi:hypothetical protein
MEILLNRLSVLPKKIVQDSLWSTRRFAFGVRRSAFVLVPVLVLVLVLVLVAVLW